jgi:hypothetical protein
LERGKEEIVADTIPVAQAAGHRVMWFGVPVLVAAVEPEAANGNYYIVLLRDEIGAFTERRYGGHPYVLADDGAARAVPAQASLVGRWEDRQGLAVVVAVDKSRQVG